MRRWIFLALLLTLFNAGPAVAIWETDFEADTVTATADPQVDALNTTVGALPIQYEDGFDSQRLATIETLGTRVYRHWLKFANVTTYGRVQLVLTPFNKSSIVQTHRMYLHNDISAYRDYAAANTWFTLWEAFCGAPFAGDPFSFRLTFDLIKQAGTGQPLWFLIVGARWNGTIWEAVWASFNDQYSVPDSQWLQMEIMYLQGNASTGRFRLKVDGATLLDVTNWTYDPQSPTPVPMTHLHAFKTYTNNEVIAHIRNNGPSGSGNGAIQVYWDDLSLIDGIPSVPTNLRIVL